jgi:hypothetical protein
MVRMPSPKTPAADKPPPSDVAQSTPAEKVLQGPQAGNHSSRVTIAFPFSQIRTQEPSAELAEVAALLVDLLAVLRQTLPDAPLEALADRAEALRKRTG